MGEPRMTEDILPLTEFRAKLTDRIDGLSTGSGCLIVTRNGKPAAVVLSPAEYDRLNYQSYVRSKLNAGLSDVASGRTMDHDHVLSEATRAAHEQETD